MKVCSVCRKCYNDLATVCTEDNGSLIQVRDGDCLSVEGYRIDFRVESDSSDELYRATHLDSEKSVLIRFIKTGDADGALQKELEAVAAINHPNLARVYEFGENSDNEFYAVLEDVGEQSLRDYLEINSPLKERHAIKIARQIAEGLEELHSKNIIHRGVSPANIYFTNSKTNNFEVKLQNYDFGAAVQNKVVKSANGIDAKTEIFRYYSPEQLSGEKIDLKSDIYSLAVVFYEMLLGRSPYNAINPQAIVSYIFEEDDVMKLHFDLRALIGYTLRQSLQHRLHLRPPTTNNLARQYRHLELVATPPEAGLQKTKNKKPKPIKNISGYRANNPEPAEKQIVEEVKIFEPKIEEEEIFKPEIVEPDIAEAVVLQTNQTEFEVLPATSISEISPVKNDLELTETFEEPIQTETKEINVEKFSDEEIENEVTEFSETADQKIETDDVNFIEDTDFDEAENPSEDIHITNRDVVEEIENVDFLTEAVEFAEPEFIEESVGKKSPTLNGYEMNSFDAYSKPASFGINKIHIYTAGVLGLIILGIVLAVGISNLNNNETISSKNPASVLPNPNAIEKGAQTFKKAEEIPVENESEIPDTNKAIIKTGFERNVRNDSPAETESKQTAPTETDKTVGKSADRKPAKTIKNRVEENNPIKKDKTVARKAKAENSKTTSNSSVGMTRPRIVPNVKPDN